MGIFSKKKEAEPLVPWKEMRSMTDLDLAISNSREWPVAIFKHSTRCGISAMAKNALETEWDFNPEEIEIWYLDLLSYREISNKIAEVTGVWHQSPQIILLDGGAAVYNASHSAISVPALHQAMPA